MACQWKAFKNKSNYGSNKQMVHDYFNRFVPLLPTPEEVLHGIIMGQFDQLKMHQDKQEYSSLAQSTTQMWNNLLKKAKSVLNFKKPLTHRILSDSKHEFVKVLVYIYSMESFIFREISKVSRAQDNAKIKYYGPFASALSYIIHCGNRKNTGNSQKSGVIYRGLRMP